MTVEEYLQHYLATMTERAKVRWPLTVGERLRHQAWALSLSLLTHANMFIIGTARRK